MTRFDAVARGIARGKHQNGAWPPRTKYPLAIVFTLADEGDPLPRRVPPNSMRAPEDGYFREQLPTSLFRCRFFSIHEV